MFGSQERDQLDCINCVNYASKPKTIVLEEGNACLLIKWVTLKQQLKNYLRLNLNYFLPSVIEP